MTNYGAYTPSGEVFSQRVKFRSQSKICHYRPSHRVGRAYRADDQDRGETPHPIWSGIMTWDFHRQETR